MADKDFVIENGVLTKYTGKGVDIVIPDGVTAIGEHAFSFSDITSVKIPPSVTSIGKSAFFCCMKLADVTINNGTRTIGNCAFEQSAITNLIIPDSVTTIGHMAFSECHNLTSISISDSVTSISEKAFFWCESLESVFYKGSKAGFKKLVVFDNENNLFDNGKKNKKIYFYSEEQPSEDEMWDYFWHYVEGVPTMW